MNYEEAVAYIEDIPRFTTKNSLDHTRECLRRLGDPQRKFRVIHVAGTNGKGSTCAFITSVLREAGYSCGLFTSPHLVEINERFQINEEVIDDDTFLCAFEKVKKLSDELVAEGSYHPTYFETLLLMGMVIFAEAGVDYVTLETGLGGRLDATTAVEDPAACVITSISLDHMQYLGNTVSEIAGEKAGSMVPGVPVIYDGNDPDASVGMRENAEKRGCPYYELKREDTEIHKITKDGIRFSLKDKTYGDTVFDIPFIARYQVMNAALAVKTIQVLEDQIPVSLEALKAGMAKTRWQGRMETVLPGVIVDGAHNEDGVEKFVETAEHFQKEFPQGKLVRAVRGEVFDVAVDLRTGSRTYGKWFGVVISAENKKQFYIPEGFAHGFLVLSDEAEFAYKCTDFYHPGDEGGLAYNDPEIGIEWPGTEGMELIISEKDKKWGGFKDTFKFQL